MFKDRLEKVVLDWFKDPVFLVREKAIDVMI